MSDTVEILTAEEARLLWPERLRKSARTLLRWAADGTIPPRCIYRAGRSIGFRRAALVAWLEGSERAQVIDMRRAG